MTELAPVPTRTRYSVWTDSNAERRSGSRMYEARWFWAASGPRGHMSGAEAESHSAEERAYAAMLLLMGDHEKTAKT